MNTNSNIERPSNKLYTIWLNFTRTAMGRHLTKQSGDMGIFEFPQELFDNYMLQNGNIISFCVDEGLIRRTVVPVNGVLVE